MPFLVLIYHTHTKTGSMTIDYSKWEKLDDDSSSGDEAADSKRKEAKSKSNSSTKDLCASSISKKDRNASNKGSDVGEFIHEHLRNASKELEDKFGNGSPVVKNSVEANRRGMVFVNGVIQLCTSNVTPVWTILTMIIDSISEFRGDAASGKIIREITYDGPSLGYEEQLSENLWELAIKLRIDASQVCDLIYGLDHGAWNCDFLGIMLRVLTEFSLTKISLDDDLNRDDRLIRFMYPQLFNRNVLSASMEFVRYRSGCVHMAKHEEFIDFILDFPLTHIFELQKKHSMKLFGDFNSGFEQAILFGMIEQALMDTLGRCLNGLDRRPDLYAAVAAKINSKIGSWESHISKVEKKIKKLMKKPFLDFVGTALTLTKTLKNLQAAAANSKHSMPKGWKSAFCMERHTMTTKHAKKNRSGNVTNDATKVELFCYCCSKKGEVGLQVKRCSRCKTNLYCSEVRS